MNGKISTLQTKDNNRKNNNKLKKLSQHQKVLLTQWKCYSLVELESIWAVYCLPNFYLLTAQEQ